MCALSSCVILMHDLCMLASVDAGCYSINPLQVHLKAYFYNEATIEPSETSRFTLV